MTRGMMHHRNKLLRVSWRRVVLLLAYGFAFTLVRHAGSLWGAFGLFSLWFPAAGLRFAFLWWQGGRITPWAALAELAAQFALEPSRFASEPIYTVVGVVGPCLVYGAVIWASQRIARIRGQTPADPLPFALAAVVGPMLACVAALPWAIPIAMKDGIFSPVEFASALLVFSIGDMLGILLVAPLLLWVVDPRSRATRRWLHSIPLQRWIEVAAVLAISFVVVLGLWELGLGALRGPILLASWWAALRTGRIGAWLASVATCGFFLPQSMMLADESMRISLHMMLVTNAAGAFVIGAYAEAQHALRRQIQQRDRMLRRAERLKNVRAMSVAVIHEVSQPLSTLSLEADHLLDQIDRGETGDQLRETVGLLARKADDLSTLVRRLRQFGSEGEEDHQILSVRWLVDDAVKLSLMEGATGDAAIRAAKHPDIFVRGADIELRHALLNLLRNALRASDGAIGGVEVSWRQEDDRAIIEIDNAVTTPGGRGGLGIGLVISRSIVEAHGGSIRLDGSAPGRMRASVMLPIYRNEE